MDDCLCMRYNAEECLREIDKCFQMKHGSIGDPDTCLGVKLQKVQLNNGVHCWALSPTKCVQEAVKNVKTYIKQNFGYDKFPKVGSGAWPNGYTSETDATEELDPKMAQCHQSLMGALHWMVELGRVDVITETSVPASHMAMPRQGHLDAAIHAFGHLERKMNTRMVFDPTHPEIDQDMFQTCKWMCKYSEVKEAIPINMPEPFGKAVDLRLFVDADFAGDKARRRSRTGYFIFINSALMLWLLKWQATVETSVFGAEFVAMKQGVEALRGL